MAATFATSFLVPSAPKRKVSNPRRVSSSKSSSFLSGSISFLPGISLELQSLLLSRKPLRVKATTLQEEDEKGGRGRFFLLQKTSSIDQEEAIDSGVSTSTPSRAESWIIKFEQTFNIALTESMITILDAFYHDRHYARFYVLETIARVPYFSFISVLHLYESLGWWRRADYLKVHFAESWNEMHHLLIMEELGGNSFWLDRFLAQSIAVGYYFMTVFMYMLSPRMAYHFSECVEKHAFSTYDKFLKLKEEELKKLPAPEAAIKYYMSEDLYLFDEFQTARAPRTRRPKIENLYDAFVNIRDDEAEHCKTMKACQTPGSLRSPHSNMNMNMNAEADEDEPESGSSTPEADCEGII
ncbi:ubiquinol oxidase 4, chloroplastic/chromoplastic-like [Dioscorea cayenensis subsp. rotundata]|uniref:Ubiquinol oxidase n=1 Tax=Dioscorea cayennensis subsp. rotundata TaxID=55577 RepID=A0AB40CQP1_DIOCR|nr:ubiquinol oxidase 4, chloroplastic/chromoplastic-like [Dioscorea cayenensis subsp. rotundata]